MAKAIRKASVVSVQLEIPDEANEQVLRLAKQAHVPTILNAAPFRDIPESYSDLVDYWIVNEIEASQFCGCVIQRAEDCEPMCCHPQIMSGRQVWVVTLGRNGAVLIDSLGLRDIPGIEVNAVDSTGAGDSFTGGFAVGMAEGMNAYEAAQFANKIAALSVTKLGGMSGLPTRVEYIAKFGVQEQTV
jgi:ribokinase